MPFKFQPACCCGTPTPACLEGTCPGKTWPAVVNCTVTGSGTDGACCDVVSASGTLNYSATTSTGGLCGGMAGPGYSGSFAIGSAAGCDCSITVWLVCTGVTFELCAELINSGTCGCTSAVRAGTITSLACSPFDVGATVTFATVGSCACSVTVHVTENPP